MMVIGIDAREVQKFPTGIGRYFSGLVDGLLDPEVSRDIHLPGGHPWTPGRWTVGNYKPKFILFVNGGNPLIGKDYPENWEVKIVWARPKSFLQQILFPVEVWLGFRQVSSVPPTSGESHSGHLGGVLVRGSEKKILLTNPFGFTIFCPVPQALVILDLIYKHFPQEASFRAKLYDAVLGKIAAHRAKVIFTCSENSKRDVVKFLGVSEGRVVVTLLGVPLSSRCSSLLATHGVAATRSELSQDDKKVASEVLKKYDIQKPYVLCVGNMREHKNLRGLLEAVSIVKSQKLKVKNKEFGELFLVIVGSDVGKRKKDYYLLFTDYCLPEFVKILRSVPDEDLFHLYRQAEVLVQPSLYEGFGISVLEAMACGCPVVSSNASSLPEVGGDAPVYVDPNDSRDIARGITEVLGYNEAERAWVVERGLKQVKKFSWEKMATKTLEALLMNLNEC